MTENTRPKMWTTVAINRVLTAWLLIVILLLVGVFFVGVPKWSTYIILIASLVAVVAGYVLVRMGRETAVVGTICFVLWLSVTSEVINNGGMFVPSWAFYMPIMMMVGMFLGKRSIIFATFATLIVFAVATWGMAAGFVKPLEYDLNGSQYLVMSVTPILMVSTLVFFISRAFNRSLDLVQARSADLAASEKRFRTMFEQASDAILIVEPETLQILDANEEACRSLGYTHAEICTLFASDISPDLLAKRPDLADQIFQDTAIQRRQDGSSFPVSIRASLVELDGVKRVMLTSHDLTAQEEAYARLELSNAEKESLLREVHHRVDNNLQVITSMLRLQQSRIQSMDDVAQANRDMQNRVRSMYLVHRQLYRSPNLATVDMSVYLQKLTSEIGVTYRGSSQRVQFLYDMETVQLKLSTAIPVGLLVNEVVTNALKYAFPDDAAGIVSLRLTADDETIKLVVSDSGIGIADDILNNRNRTIGMVLLDQLADQIRATLTLKTSKAGTAYTLVFAR